MARLQVDLQYPDLGRRALLSYGRLQMLHRSRLRTSRFHELSRHVVINFPFTGHFFPIMGLRFWCPMRFDEA